MFTAISTFYTIDLSCFIFMMIYKAYKYFYSAVYIEERLYSLSKSFKALKGTPCLLHMQ